MNIDHYIVHEYQSNRS